ncbi:metallophosphoesterase [candidate division KSB1 bacterium]|nr:metallophosphoesterase [candidate division KSB1 bacterium]
MKMSGFIIFLLVVLSVYTAVNIYIVRRHMQLLPDSPLKSVVFWTLLSLILAYPLSRFAEGLLSPSLANGLTLVGSYYLAAMVFFFFILLIADFSRLIHSLGLPILPQALSLPSVSYRYGLMAILVTLVFLLVFIGAWNAKNPRVKTIPIKIEKTWINKNPLRLVLASDLHIGPTLSEKHLEKIVALINGQNPDIVLLAGDIIDQKVDALKERDYLPILSDIESRHGVYAVTGNHEFYVGVEGSIDYLRAANINVLRDSVALIDNSFYLIGRDDKTLEQMGGQRETLSSLLQAVDHSKPLILIDHQPLLLEKAAENHIDLQVSGHTHHGQIFPFNFITNAVFEQSWGLTQKGATRIYVSCGVGTWGPPVRLGNHPEIVVFELSFI